MTSRSGAFVLEADVEEALRHRVLSGDLPTVLVLPGTLRDGVSYYADWDIPAVKLATEAGVDADYLQPRQNRKVRGEFAATTVADFAIAVSEGTTGIIASSAVLAVVGYVKARIAHLRGSGLVDDAADIRVRIATYRRDGQQVDIEGLEVTGPATSVIGLLTQTLAGPGPLPDIGNLDTNADGGASSTDATSSNDDIRRDEQPNDQ